MYKIYFLIFLYLISVKYTEAKDFIVTDNYSHELHYKPFLKERFSGVKNIIIFAPQNKTQKEDFVIRNFQYYLEQLGLHVNVIPIKYRIEEQQYGNVIGRYHLVDDYISHYWQNANSLGIVINYVETFGNFLGNSHYAKVILVDYLNNWDWNFDIDIPSNGEKLRKKIGKEMGSTWKYNPSYAFIPKSKRGNYNQTDIEQNYKAGNYNQFEGIYEGDTYKLGMKQATDGKYYLIFLNSKEMSADWQSGDIKAELRESAIPGVFKGTWYGKWKQPMQKTFIFDSTSFTLIDDDDKSKETYLRMFPSSSDILSSTQREEWGGSGFALKNGYLATNYHVVENADSIKVSGINGNFSLDYSAEIIAVDKTNDLAILKIADHRFKNFGPIPYKISTGTTEVGEDIFVLGYPLTSTMGDEIKLTTGVISSKTGFQGDITYYQISAPIQPGNSGGPLFDKSGNIIGIVSSKYTEAENVGYALKSSYLVNLAESLISSDILPQNNTISTLSRPNKIKRVDDFIFMIKCSKVR